MDTAAFYRVEGAIVARPAIAAAAYLVGNAQHVGDRLLRLGGVAAAFPLSLGGDRTLAARVAWMGLRGMSEDRLVVLGEEYGERHLVPHVKDVARQLLAESRARKHRIVLVSESLDVIVGPLARSLGVPLEDVVANRAEMSAEGRATGRLCDPFIGGQLGGGWARAFAKARNIDLERSFVYGASGGDGVLLATVGHACAVTPDRALRRLARDNGWPVVEA
jgi:phosphoserine phosphatase